MMLLRALEGLVAFEEEGLLLSGECWIAFLVGDGPPYPNAVDGLFLFVDIIREVIKDIRL
jgi:hypothetical protein